MNRRIASRMTTISPSLTLAITAKSKAATDLVKQIRG